ncbi:Alpha/Beta hydrolase protein [Mycena vitilis]|nr:Alpha/Beta hydrolase protein [Mycena vitilis]
MPNVALSTPTGDLVFNYVISTPTQPSAPSIDPALPTVLFLHSLYIPKISYHSQFADRELRRFNLIALDLRCHGETVGRAGKDYGPEVAARDVALFMSTLNIPRYHLFGVSMGGCIALQTSILFPASVLSVFIVSTLPLTEPPDVGTGLQEIYDCWAEEVSQGQTVEELQAAFSKSNSYTGAIQLAVNSCPTKLYKAIVKAALPFGLAQWGRPDQLDDLHAVAVDFFTLRKACTVDAMRNIECPVYLVHCEKDIAYDISATNEIAEHLRTAGVSVEVVQIPDAPQFGIVTHAKEVNNLFHQFMTSVCPDPLPIPDHVESPFKAQLAAVGYDSDTDEDGDDEDELIIPKHRLG